MTNIVLPYCSTVVCSYMQLTDDTFCYFGLTHVFTLVVWGQKLKLGSYRKLIFANYTSVPVHTTNRLWPQGWTLTHAYLQQNNFKPDVWLVALHLV